MTQAVISSSRPTIRWPFRVLAALVVVLGVAVVFLWALATWQHGANPWHDGSGFGLVYLPAVAFMLNHFVPAALYGRSARQPCWPFASEGVCTVYFLLLFLLKGI